MPDPPVVDFAFLVDNLEKRPQMHMPVANYDTIVAYLHGLDLGWTRLARADGPLRGFREFLLARSENHRSLGWSQLIEVIAERERKDPRTLLFQLLGEFLELAPENSPNPRKEST
jgi:hypothetical protein